MSDPAELTEKKAEKIIRQGLRDREWTKEGVEDTISALHQMWGPWTYATVMMIKDLAEIFEEMKSEYGEPPDED